MRNIRRIVAVALLAMAPGAVIAPLGAQQAAQPEREVQITFGFKCGNQFIVRNDTEQPVDLEFQVAGRAGRAKVHLNARAVLEVKSSADAALEVLFNGTVVASAVRGNVACAVDASRNIR